MKFGVRREVAGAGKCAVTTCQRYLIPIGFGFVAILNQNDVGQYLLEASPPSLVAESRRASYVFPISSRNATSRSELRSALSPFRSVSSC